MFEANGDEATAGLSGDDVCDFGKGLALLPVDRRLRWAGFVGGDGLAASGGLPEAGFAGDGLAGDGLSCGLTGKDGFFGSAGLAP